MGQQAEALLSKIQQWTPGFAIIGASTSGEIADSEIHDETILLSFSLFDSTDVEVIHVADSSHESGVELARSLAHSDVRLAIAFGNTLNANPEHFISGLSHGAPNLFIAGGNAGDNACFEHSFVIANGEVYTQGMVLALLRGPSLQVSNRAILNWAPIGNEMRITRCQDNVVYELNGKPALEVYGYYLGEEVLATAPQSLMEFPLIAMVDGIPVARSPVGLADDGGILYAGGFRPEEPVRFGVADIGTILSSACDSAQEMGQSLPIEAVYIYSCTGRRSFLKENMTDEVAALATLGPCAGFFTYGEYLHTSNSNRLLNITSTLVTLSESTRIEPRTGDLKSINATQASTLRSLTHLSNLATRELNQSMKQLEQYKNALDQTAIVSKTDKAGRITYVNSLFEQISGYSAEEVLGKTHRVLRHPDMPSEVFDDMWRTISAKKTWTGTIKNLKKNGDYYYVHSTIVPILDAKGQITEYIGIRDDITNILVNEERIAQQLTDKLTGLPSRTRLLEDTEREQSSVLALADVSSFKSINDYYGIATGDRLIAGIAQVLSAQLADTGIRVYRLYGAGFAFLPAKGMSVPVFERQLLRASQELHANPVEVAGEPIDVELYFGMSEGEDHLLALAEAALQKAKEEKVTESILTYSERDQNHLNNLFWIQEVKDAISDGRMISHYQPIVDASGQDNGCKYESLLRMVDRDGEIISPFHFLDIIKHTKYYPRITRDVVARAIAKAKETGCSISVNLSAEDIANRETREFIIGQLREGGGNNLIFEITEGESLKDYQEVKAFIRSIRAYKAEVAIDDFGSGYSNFSYLVEIQPEYIKIDGSIISGILTDNSRMLVTESIIDLGHKIGARVIAEFVSSDEIADCLRTAGVDFFQGFAVGRPGPL